MSVQYNVNVLSCKEIHELPSGWTNEDFKEILELADFEDWDEIDVSELKDYTILALQDMEPDEAGEVVLKYKFQGRLSNGQIQNLSHEMMDEKLWEEYTDIRLHADLYNCAVLLKWAFPKEFPETDAIKCVLDIEANDQEPLLKITKTFLARLLANGMNERGLLNRLFSEQIIQTSFPEAEGIIWEFYATRIENRNTLTVFSSEYWLHDMKSVSSYTSNAFSD